MAVNNLHRDIDALRQRADGRWTQLAAASPNLGRAVALQRRTLGTQFDLLREAATYVAASPAPPETRVLSHLADGLPVLRADIAPLPTPPPHPIGWLDRADGTVVLAGALAGGVLPARTAEFLAAVERPVVITPWRSLLLCDLDEWAAEQVVRVLAPMGLIFDADSPHVE